MCSNDDAQLRTDDINDDEEWLGMDGSNDDDPQLGMDGSSDDDPQPGMGGKNQIVVTICGLHRNSPPTTHVLEEQYSRPCSEYWVWDMIES